MPELKLIVMPPERRKRPVRSWRTPGRDTVAQREQRRIMVTRAAAFCGTVTVLTAMWFLACAVGQAIAWAAPVIAGVAS